MFKKNKKIIIFIILSIISLNLLHHDIVLADSKRPRYSQRIHYNQFPYIIVWLSDSEIIYIKTVDHIKHYYDWLSSIAKGMEVLTKKEIQICAININNCEERVIKNIVINYTHSGGIMHWEDKIFEGIVDNINYISTDQQTCFIAFSANFVDNEAIYTMNFDGTDVKKIMNEGSMPKWSPDGKKILYSTNKYVNPRYKRIKKDSNSAEWRRVSSLSDYYIYETTFWLIDLDGANKEKIITDKKIYSYTWHPDGKKITFRKDEATEKRRTLYKTYILDLNSKEINPFEINATPIDWSCDGTKVYTTEGLYEISSGKRINKATLHNSRLSPDGTKFVGNLGAEGAVCVMNVDGSGLKILIKDSYTVRTK